MAPKAEIQSLPEVPRPLDVTSQEYAYRRLRHSLMIGAIDPGKALTIRGLAEAIGVSPTPVREALRRLSSENALLVLENRRIMVPEMTTQRFEELVALRCCIEAQAAERALPYMSEVKIDELEMIDARIDSAFEAGDLEASTLLNHRFHTELHAANPVPVALPMIESLRLQLGPFLRVAARYAQEYYTVDRHKEIVAALRKRDAIALAMAVESDIRDGVGRLGRNALRRILGEAA